MTKQDSVGRHANMPDDVRQAVSRRLHLIEGQVGGLKRMLDDDRYCVDVLTQIASVREGLRQVGRLVLHSHLQHCVTRAVRDGDDAIYGELMEVIDRFNRQG